MNLTVDFTPVVDFFCSPIGITILKFIGIPFALMCSLVFFGFLIEKIYIPIVGKLMGIDIYDEDNDNPAFLLRLVIYVVHVSTFIILLLSIFVKK